MRRSVRNDELIPLDNSAIIYPPTVARYNNHTFRLSVDLEVEIVPSRLLTSLERTLERFPYYALSLHSGFYWYYFTPNKRGVAIYEDVSHPCGFFYKHRYSNRYLFKVHYSKNRIALELFHALTDGTGALIFLKSLVGEYLRLSGFEVGSDPQIFDLNSPIAQQESEDSFERFYKPIKSVFGFENSAFHMDSKSPFIDEVQVISAKMEINSLKEISLSYNSTITEFLVAELLDAMQRIQQKQVKKPRRYKPIRVSVPVNIRKVFNSITMRNFTLFVVVGIDPRLGEYTFEEIVEQVRYQLRANVNAKSLSKQVARNVAGRHNWLIRYSPNFIKKPLMKLLSDSYGDAIYSTTLSNLGNVSLPQTMKEVTKRFDFFLSPSKTNKVSCAAIGSNGYLNLNFTSIYQKRVDFEREVLTSLVQKGLHVEVSTNRPVERVGG